MRAYPLNVTSIAVALQRWVVGAQLGCETPCPHVRNLRTRVMVNRHRDVKASVVHAHQTFGASSVSFTCSDACHRSERHFRRRHRLLLHMLINLDREMLCQQRVRHDETGLSKLHERCKAVIKLLLVEVSSHLFGLGGVHARRCLALLVAARAQVQEHVVGVHLQWRVLRRQTQPAL